MQPKTYYIKTLGCQANVADSQKLISILNSLGFEQAISMQESDVFIINSCSVRQKSEDKVYGLGKIFKNNSKKPLIILAGCMVGSSVGERVRYSLDYLKNKTPWVDEYISPEQLFDIPEILTRRGLLVASTMLPPQKPPVIASSNFVNISYGCDNFCTYCVVPYARGKEISRDKKEILDEVCALLSQGITEITLCGQNVNSWGLTRAQKAKIRLGSTQKLPFADLLREVHALYGIEKIEFLSSNPFDFTQDLIDTLKLPKIAHHLHIAVQSGNNDVLYRMNRGHTVEEFINLINEIKKVKPNITFGTDAIVGFPGETFEQFMDTVKLFQIIKFKVAFISMYSPRMGTIATKMYENDVSLDEKRKRHAILTRVWKELS